jgi:hypothetical protein
MSYALRQHHGLPGELKREHALFSGISPPSSSLQSTPLPKAEPRSTISTTIEGEHKQAFTRIKPFRNGTPKGSYRIAVARLTGLECTPMSTFPSGLGHQNVEKSFVHTPRLPLA